MKEKDNDSSLLQEIQAIHSDIKKFICKHVRLPHPYDLFEVVGKVTLYGQGRDPLKNDDVWSDSRFELYDGDTIIINEFDDSSAYRGELTIRKFDVVRDFRLPREIVHDLIKGGWIKLVTTDDSK